jgi:hypothetical protein
VLGSAFSWADDRPVFVKAVLKTWLCADVRIGDSAPEAVGLFTPSL